SATATDVSEPPPAGVSRESRRAGEESASRDITSESAAAPTPSADAVDAWTAQSPPPGTRLAERRKPERASAPWGYIFGGLIVLVAVIWGVTQMSGRDSGQAPEPTAAAVDTTEAPAQPVRE